MFDSWQDNSAPRLRDFVLPYQQRVVQQVKQTHPDTPFNLYINGSAGILERMALAGVDIVMWTGQLIWREARQ